MNLTSVCVCAAISAIIAMSVISALSSSAHADTPGKADLETDSAKWHQSEYAYGAFFS